MTKLFDVIIFGATGYTGRYCIRKGTSILNGMTWAIAGRNQQKLENVLHEIGSEMKTDLSKIPTIIADVSNQKSIDEMTSKAKVIVNCCGPYHLYGESVVKACIENAASHVDVSGEPLFMEKMQLKYHEAAREKGVYIVSACGLESIPAEMGMMLMEKNFDGTINSVDGYLRTYMDRGSKPSGAMANIGTFHSAIEAIANHFESVKVRKELFSQTKLPKCQPSHPNKWIHRQEIAGRNRWCVPLPDPDSGVVRRSQKFFFDNENKRPVQMHSYMAFNKIYEVIGLVFFMQFLIIISQFAFGRKLLLNYIEYFTLGIFSSKGPKEEDNEKVNFESTLIGLGWNNKKLSANENLSTSPNKKIVVTVKGKNPGYGATAAALLLSATTILNESDKMPGNGGVISPAAAFKRTNLIKQLQNNGFTFEVTKVEDL